MNRLAWIAPLALVTSLGCSAAPTKPPEVAAAAPAKKPEVAATATAPAPEGGGEEGPICDIVCQGAKITNLSTGGVAIGDAESHTIEETENANRVLDAMHTDLLACYKARVRVMPTAKGTLVLDILIGQDGKVRKVDTSGGDSLGPAKECIVKRVEKGEFAPPHGGGTLKIQVPFTLKVQGDEST